MKKRKKAKPVFCSECEYYSYYTTRYHSPEHYCNKALPKKVKATAIQKEYTELVTGFADTRNEKNDCKYFKPRKPNIYPVGTKFTPQSSDFPESYTPMPIRPFLTKPTITITGSKFNLNKLAERIMKRFTDKQVRP